MDDLLDPDAVAKLFGVTTRTIRTWIHDGELLAPIELGRRQYWLKSQLVAWLASRSPGPLPPPPTTPSAPTRRGRPRLDT